MPYVLDAAPVVDGYVADIGLSGRLGSNPRLGSAGQGPVRPSVGHPRPRTAAPHVQRHLPRGRRPDRPPGQHQTGTRSTPAG
ncbi:hypothetical protein [Nonomuraea dietziae]|uniref:hypothetical protein n=1 Tax=Nonomuraea dietziae TaxID=65515 RepID=UPI0031DEA5F4